MTVSSIAPVSIMQASEAVDCYAAALAYEQLNLSVLPLNGKRPTLAALSSQPGSPPSLLNSWKRVRPRNPRPKVATSSDARRGVIL